MPPDAGISTLDPVQRAKLAAALIDALDLALPHAVASLRGSLARGNADQFSDIDLRWLVPDGAFSCAVSRLPAVLGSVAPVASLRFDPDFQQSARRRMAFVRFAGLPLFWRVDLDIVARSVAHDPDAERDNRAAPGPDWSATESSLANAVAAAKALLRGQPEKAAHLLERREARVGLVLQAIPHRERIFRLSSVVAAIDPAQDAFATEVQRLLVMRPETRA